MSFTAFLLWRRSLEVAMEHKESSLIRGRSGRRSDGHSGNSGACIDEISHLLKPLSISYESPASLSPAPRNARQHSSRQVSQLCASIAEFGFLVPILVDERQNVIAGHGRLAAAQQLGLSQVPVVQIGHLTAEQKRAYLLADNRLAELSGWDTDILKVELEELSALDLPFEFEITGFDTVDIDRLREPVKKVADDPDDHLPKLAELPVSCPGDLWALGPHRLLCGNSCEPGTYKRLLGTTAVDMVFTDPPYNVPIQGHVTKQARHREFAMASGEMTPQEFTAFLDRSFRLMHEASSDGAIHFICMDWRHLWEILAAAAPVYGKPKQLCVWAKDNAGMGSFYRSHHELVFVFKVGDAPHVNNFGLGGRGRYRTNLWQYPSPHSGSQCDSELLQQHPTVKPVALVDDAIKDCSRRGGIILDPFGGSGTTLIAAERTGRCARLTELDPLYADLIVRRWQQTTGGKAVLTDTNQSFDERAALRLNLEAAR